MSGARVRLLLPHAGAAAARHHRHAATIAAAAAAAADAPAPASAAVRPLFSLEAPIGAATPLDGRLLASGAFGASVQPDLPIATTWGGLLKAVRARLGGGSGGGAATAATATATVAAVQAAGAAATAAAAAAGATTTTAAPAAPAAAAVMRVETVGVQLRRAAELRPALLEALTRGSSGSDGAPPSSSSSSSPPPRPGALLLLSGSHPVRQLPLVRPLLPGAVELLQQASTMRAAGELPAGVELWAVANPVTEPDAAYLERKIEAGATTVLTQPPLDWPAFERWLADAERRGLTRAARLLVGFPCLSGAANAAFWVALCQGGASAACGSLQREFAAADAGGRGAAFAGGWNRELLARLRGAPGVAGLHVMPIGAGAKRLALELAAGERAFDPATWPLV